MKKPFKPHPGHKPPVTRRDFIANGLIAGGGMMFMPGALSFLLKGENALAQTALNCPALGPAAGLIPFIAIDCAGGASLSGNLAVGSQASGSFVPLGSYSTLGITYNPSSTTGAFDSRFGAPFHAGPSPVDSTKPISKIFEGMIGRIPAAAQANTRVVTLCHSSQDDSPNNELTPVQAITQAGLKGSLIKNGMGTENSLSGGNSAAGLADSEFRPMYVKSVTTVTSALSYGATLSAYPAAYREKMAAAIANLSQSQANRFASLTLGDQFKTLVNCGFVQNKAFATTAPDIDPRKNASIASIYGITATSTDTNAKRAAIVYNALLGNSGPGVITIGGCDYHDNLPPSAPNHGDVKDLEIGREIGRIVEAAALLQKPVFIAVYSDGSVYGENSQRQWIGDSGSRSLAFMVLYKPNGVVNNKKSQIGYYGSGQTVSSGSGFWVNNTKFASYVIVANYLSVCGQLGMFPSLAPSGFNTSTAVLDSIIGFG